MLAGFIDSLAGGGGLLTIPALMAAGCHQRKRWRPISCRPAGIYLFLLYFIRRGVVNLADQKLNIFMTFVGSMSGALLVQHVQSDVLRQILPVLVICIGLYFLLMPKVGKRTDSVDCTVYLSRWWREAASVLRWLFWSGGRVVLRAGLCHAVRIQLAAKSTAHAKVLNATSNIGGLLLFALGGKVIWATGFVMLIGQFIGARMGSRLVLSKGQNSFGQ